MLRLERLARPATRQHPHAPAHQAGAFLLFLPPLARPFSPSSGARRAIFRPGLIEPVSRATAALRPEPTGPCPTGPAPTVPASSEAKESEHQPPRPTPRKRLRWRLGRGLTRLSASSAGPLNRVAALSPGGAFLLPRAVPWLHAAVTLLSRSAWLNHPAGIPTQLGPQHLAPLPPAGLSLSRQHPAPSPGWPRGCVIPERPWSKRHARRSLSFPPRN